MTDVTQLSDEELMQALQQHLQSAPAAAPPPQPPTNYDYLAASPGGAMVQGAVRTSQGGLMQLPMHALASASDLGGLAPNPVSSLIRGATGKVDDWITQQNQNYEAARNKFQNPAIRPWESVGSVPAGMIAGQLAGAPAVSPSRIGNIANNAVTGAKSGNYMGLSSPVLGEDAKNNYWLTKAKQSGLGSLVGGLGGGLLGMTALKSDSAPSTMDLKERASQMYKDAQDAGVIVKNDSLKGLASDIKTTLAEEGISKRSHTDALNSFLDIQDAAESGNPITLKGIDLLRQNVGDVAATAKTAGERRLAGIIRDKMDDFLENLSPTDTISGDSQAAYQALNQARDVWSTYKKSALLDDINEKAINRLGANYSQAGYETALRQQYRALADNKAAMRQFSPEEQDAILQIVRGGPIGNVLRSVGRFVTRGPVSGMMTMGATALGGPLAGTAMTGATEAARYGSTQSTLNSIDALRNLVKGYTPQAPMSLAPGPGNLSPALMDQLRAGLIGPAISPLLYSPQQVGR